MSVHFPPVVVSFPRRPVPLSRPLLAGNISQPMPPALLAEGDILSGRLGAIRFGADESTLGKSYLKRNPLTWLKQVGWSISQAYTRMISMVKWTLLMAAGLLGFLPVVPKTFQRYIEGRFLLGPSTVTSTFTQKDEALRAKIKADHFDMGLYQDEMRRSGLGFNPKQDKIPLHYWYIPGKAGQPSIIYSHGRGTNIGQHEGLLKGFMDRGYGILIYEYPSLSLGDGVATEQRLYKASLAASLYASQKLHIPISNQVIMGNSLGSVVAAKTVNHLEALGLGERPKALIMVSTFPTLKEAFISYRNRLGTLGRLLNENKITVKLNARAALKENKQVPVLLLQGGRDKSTPYAMAEAMKLCIPPENQADSKVVKMPLGKHKLREADFPFIVQEMDDFLHGLSPVISPEKAGA